jgi:hypothetical protein
MTLARHKARLATMASLAALLLAGCMDQGTTPPSTTPVEAALPATPLLPPLAARTENVCPLVRFLVDGRPAEAAGLDVKEAITAARQLFREQGMELVTVDRLVDRFQARSTNLRTPLADAPRTAAVSSARMDEDARGSIRNALTQSLQDLGEAELANCEWIMTGQVDVGAPRPDPQGPGRTVNVATWLTVVEAFTNRGVGDALNTGTTRGPDELSAIRRGMVYSLESVAATVGRQIQDARTFYTIALRSENSGRLRTGVQRALEDCGFAVRSVVDGTTERQLDTRFDGTITDAVEALECALDTAEAGGSPRGMDYSLKGRLITIDVPR